jgi:hypothetical protein
MNLPGGAAADHPSEPAVAAADRRRLDEIFGDVLPDVTSDERDRPGASGGAADDDRWYLDNRPPHHG